MNPSVAADESLDAFPRHSPGEPARRSMNVIGKPLHLLRRAMMPEEVPPPSYLSLVGLLIVGAVSSFLRFGGAGPRGVLWAEDGGVFLQDSLNSGPIKTIYHAYAGYIHVVPRFIASLTSLLPLKEQGRAINLSAALVQSLVGVVIYAALASRLPSRLLRLLVFAGVVAMPVGPEVLDAIASSQWFLLAGAMVASFWLPQRRGHRAVQLLMVLGAALSSPFAFLILFTALVALILRRGRETAFLAAAAGVGFIGQTIGIITAPPRITQHAYQQTVGDFIRGYVARVLGDATFGLDRHTYPGPSQGAWEKGAVVLALVALLAVYAITRRDHLALVRFGSFAALSIVVYAVPVYASDSKTDSQWFGARYFVTSTVFFYIALGLLMQPVVAYAATRWRARGEEPENGVGRRRNSSPVALLVAAVISTTLAVTLLSGLVHSFHVTGVYGRDTGNPWGSQAADAQRACLGAEPSTAVALKISPQTWVVSTTCDKIR